MITIESLHELYTHMEWADAVVWDAQDYREIPYHYGVNLVINVIKSGKLVI